MEMQVKIKTGRKPLSINKKKKAISIVLPPTILEKLLQDSAKGKADTPNRMAAKIVEKHYRRIDKRKAG